MRVRAEAAGSNIGAGAGRSRRRRAGALVIDVRAWLASASWACLCGMAAALFLTVTLVGLFILFFGALLSAMLAPLLMMLPAQWQWTGGQFVAVAVAVWLAVVLLLGAIARLAYLRCRAVVFVGPQRWPRTSSIAAGVVAAVVLLGVVPGIGAGLLPQPAPTPEAVPDEPVTV